MKYSNLAHDMTDTSSTENKALETRAKIIECAEMAFWYRGHKTTSIDDIVAAAGQSKGAFFHHFKSKKEITLLALEKYVAEELVAPIEKHFASHSRTKEALLSWMYEIYETAGTRSFKGGCLLGTLAAEMADTEDDIQAACARHFLEWENLLVSLFKDSNKNDTLLMEPRQFARVVISAYQGMMLSVKTHKDKNRAAREFQAQAELFERLIKD
ncbi:MAG: TetR/AcrR family transcriptional regulator [Micavibrio sp.]|nr:TetR/AcrR family transcriptional regulator [Micavibrio sp.]